VSDHAAGRSSVCRGTTAYHTQVSNLGIFKGEAEVFISTHTKRKKKMLKMANAAFSFPRKKYTVLLKL